MVINWRGTSRSGLGWTTVALALAAAGAVLAQDKPTFYVIAPSLTDPFWITQQNGAKQAGEDLQATLESRVGPNPAIQTHAALGDMLLPIALGFVVAVIALLVAGRLADRERQAEAPTTKTWRVISVVVSVLVVVLAVGTTVQTVRAGHSGSTAVWSGIGS